MRRASAEAPTTTVKLYSTYISSRDRTLPRALLASFRIGKEFVRAFPLDILFAEGVKKITPYT